MRLSALTPPGGRQSRMRVPPARTAGRTNGRPGRVSTAGAASHPRRIRASVAPSLPRRVSGPIERGRAAIHRKPRARPKPSLASLGQRTGAFLRSLPDHALIDRLVRGRAWIPVLGLMLAGIVAMQVEVLKLGASVGRSIERSSALETRNQLLRASVASLSDESRIERLAAGMGMIMPPPGFAGFLSGTANGDLRQAIANIHAPDAAAFLTSGSSNGAIASTSIMSSADGSITALLPQTAGAWSTGATAAGQTSPAQTTAAQPAAPQPTAVQPAAPQTTAPQTATPQYAQSGGTAPQQQQQQTAATGG